MKNKLYILGVVSTLIIFTGAIFKLNHLPGAGILITIGLSAFILVFLPFSLRNIYLANRNREYLPLYIVTYLTCFVVFTSLLFKIQHWPFSGILLTIALPFPYIIFLPVFLNVTTKNKNFSIYNVVFVLSLLALNSVFSALLALNVSKERINDSYNLSQNYNKLKKEMTLLPDTRQRSEISQSIDEVIKIVNEYQSLILKSEGRTIEQWRSNPEILTIAYAQSKAFKNLEVSEVSTVGSRLFNGLKNLILEMQKTKGLESLSLAAPAIFELNYKSEPVEAWGEKIFQSINLVWTLMYLDGLETNLLLIKAATR